MTPNRVVITALAGMGNSIMTMPMVRQLKRAWPDCKIAVLARTAAMGEPLRRMPEVEEMIITGQGIGALFRNIGRMWQRKPDLLIVPFPSNRWHYTVLALTSFAKRSVLHRYPVGYFRAMHFIGQRIPAERGIHDVIQNLRLLKAVGIEPDESDRPRFEISDAERARAVELLGPNANGRFIAIHPGGGSYHVLARAKRWPTRNYAELIAAIQGDLKIPVIVLEGPDESGVADEIRKHSKSQIAYLKLTGPLGEAAAVLERATLYAGSDSGLAHLAAAVGRRAVTIFAPADPDRVCPYGSRDLVVQPDLPCTPCYTYPFVTPYNHCKCREPFCIDAVPVQCVLDAIRRALSSRP